MIIFSIAAVFPFGGMGMYILTRGVVVFFAVLKEAQKYLEGIHPYNL